MKTQKQKPLDKGAGVLLPVASLPSNYGIGTFGKAAFDFIDFLNDAGLKYWQVLPLGPTGFGDSPYQSFSAFAGNPYFVDLDLLIEEGLLDAEEISGITWFDREEYIDYEKIYLHRFKVLKKAWVSSQGQYEKEPDYLDFCDENSFWLEDYALFMSVKETFNNKEWLKWPEDIRLRETAAVEKYKGKLADEMKFWKFIQYKFALHWKRLKKYAVGKGILIIGDIPLYVALDSVDAWVNYRQFQMDKDHRPTMVAGVPPDLFSKTGQLWGNPLYDWDAMMKDNFSWWRRRIRHSANLYEIIRIDHFIGIIRYYAIPAEDESAENGSYRPGPGMDLLDAINEEIGNAKIIAEDLGVITEEVEALLGKVGYPGMKVLMFAFDGTEDNTNLPAHIKKNSVVYGGTHDNDTLCGYISGCDKDTLDYIKDSIEVEGEHDLTIKIMEAGFRSHADVVIFQMQDYLLLGNETKTNTPATIGINWRWRLKKGQASSDLAGVIRKMKNER